MDLQVTQDSDLHVIHVPSELLDRLEIQTWVSGLLEFVERDDTKNVIVNFDATNRFGSEAISGLLRAARRLREKGYEIRLCDMSPTIREVFRIMSLDGTVFQILDTVRDAATSLHQ